MRPIAPMAVAVSLLLAPAPLLAHGEPPPPTHGGEVRDAQGVWIEPAVKGSDVAVFVSDEDRRPVPAQQVTGTATVMAGTRSYKVELSPTGTNSLAGTLPVPATGRLVATVSLKVDGRVASARFGGAG